MSMTGANRTPIGRPVPVAVAPPVQKLVGSSLLKPTYLQSLDGEMQTNNVSNMQLQPMHPPQPMNLPQPMHAPQPMHPPQPINPPQTTRSSSSHRSDDRYSSYERDDNSYSESYSHKSSSSSYSSRDRDSNRDRNDRNDRSDRRDRDSDSHHRSSSSRSDRDRDRDRDSRNSSSSSSRKRDVPDDSRDRDGGDAKKKKRKSRFGDETEKAFIPGMPTMLPPNLSKEQEEAYLAQLQIEELSRKLRTGDLGISINPEERSPSPEPIYDSQGKRLNTREFRTRRKLEEDRHQLIERMKVVNPEYKPPADYRPPANKVSDKVMIPQDENPDINFVGLLIGPRGNTLKALEKDTGAKIIIRGKGSVKEGKVGRKDGQPLPGEDEPLHAYITGTTPEAVKKAVEKVKDVIKQGIEVPEGQNDLRRMQLRELALLNGTLRDSDIRCSNCGGTEHKSWQCPDKPNVTNSIVCTNCGGAGHIARDCKSARPGMGSGMQFAGGDKGNIDEEYMSLMAELGEAPPPVKHGGMGQGQRRFNTGNLFDRQGPMKAIAQGPPTGGLRGPPPSLLDPIGPPPQSDDWRGSRPNQPRPKMEEGQGGQGGPPRGQPGPVGPRGPLGSRPPGPPPGSRFGGPPPQQRPGGPRGPRPLMGNFVSGSEEESKQKQPSQQYPPQMSQQSQSWGQPSQGNMMSMPPRPMGVPPPPTSQGSVPPPPPPAGMMHMGGMGPMGNMGQQQQMMGWGYPAQPQQQQPQQQQWNPQMGGMGMAPNMMQMYGGGWQSYAGVPPPSRPGQQGSVSADLAAYAQAGLPSMLPPPPPPPPS